MTDDAALRALQEARKHCGLAREGRKDCVLSSRDEIQGAAIHCFECHSCGRRINIWLTT